jgi:N-ethylmaleimide reductase
LETAEVEEIVQQYRQAAANAWAAGFDGVEVHAANGYLPHQFLSPTTNRRTDRYGGAPENRARFLQEIVGNIAEVMPIDRVGVRLSPTAGYNSPRDPDPAETYGWVAAMLQRQGVAFIEIADTNAWASKPDRDELLRMIGPHFTGPLILNGGLSPDKADELVSEGSIDLASFARQFIANPDLPGRIEAGGPFNEPRHVGWYGGGDEGYTDYEPLKTPSARDR